MCYTSNLVGPKAHNTIHVNKDNNKTEPLSIFPEKTCTWRRRMRERREAEGLGLEWDWCRLVQMKEREVVNIILTDLLLCVFFFFFNCHLSLFAVVVAGFL